jgi:hypothetical protein
VTLSPQRAPDCTPFVVPLEVRAGRGRRETAGSRTDRVCLVVTGAAPCCPGVLAPARLAGTHAESVGRSRRAPENGGRRSDVRSGWWWLAPGLAVRLHHSEHLARLAPRLPWSERRAASNQHHQRHDLDNAHLPSMARSAV